MELPRRRWGDLMTAPSPPEELHAGNQLSMDGHFSHCDQMPHEVLCEVGGSPNDDNDTDDERITPSNDENE